MRHILVYLTSTISLSFFSCNGFHSNRPIETKTETIECIIGEWVSEKLNTKGPLAGTKTVMCFSTTAKDSDIKQGFAGSSFNEIRIYTEKDGIKTPVPFNDVSNWEVNEPKKVIAFSTPFRNTNLYFDILSWDRMILNGQSIFIKR